MSKLYSAQRDSEYEVYCARQNAHGNEVVKRSEFDLLHWLHSDARLDWTQGHHPDEPVKERPVEYPQRRLGCLGGHRWVSSRLQSCCPICDRRASHEIANEGVCPICKISNCGENDHLFCPREIPITEEPLSRNHVDEAIGGAHDKPISTEVVERKKQVIEGLAKPKLRHYTSAERKGMPVHTGVMLYFPDALAAISRLSKAGNDKHNPGEPLHWARGKSKDHSDCQARHMLTPDEIDPETGETERVAAAWRALADLQLAEEKRLVAAGILPLSGVIE